MINPPITKHCSHCNNIVTTANTGEKSKQQEILPNFNWYLFPLFVVVIYIYNVEIGRKNFRVVFAGLAFWGMDRFNEIWNALIFYFSGWAPVWGAPGDTAGLILIGLNVETCMMFAIMGIAAL